MGSSSSNIKYLNIKSIENKQYLNNNYHNHIKYHDGSTQDVILTEKQEKKLQKRFLVNQMYYELSTIKYCDIMTITKFKIIDKNNKDDEFKNYPIIISYTDDIMTTYMKLNKFQLKFFLSMMKKNKVKCTVECKT
jgi:hypothetical protein